jgi:hypothetical protein
VDPDGRETIEVAEKTVNLQEARRHRGRTEACFGASVPPADFVGRPGSEKERRNESIPLFPALIPTLLFTSRRRAKRGGETDALILTTPSA